MKYWTVIGLLSVFALSGNCIGAFAEGAAIENDNLRVLGEAGKSGLVVSSKQSDSQFALRFIGQDGSAAGIKSVSEVKSDDEGSSLKVTTANGEALVTLSPGCVYAEIMPVKGLKAVAIGIPTRFALMPDFFAMDVVLDARRVRQEKATALADNFYLMPLDSGNGVVFCIWPGADPKEQTREESVVELSVGGEGEARKFTESRAYFPGSKPVFVALLEGANYWRCEEGAAWDLSKPVKSEWSRPFDARWRASIMTKEGKRVQGWGVSILSFYFPELRKGRSGWVWQDENVNGAIGWTDKYGRGVPEGASQGLGHYAHPCWFTDKDTYLFPPVDKSKTNIYDCAIIYPLQRSKDTPLAVMTPSDVMKQTLGVGPCEYILDKEGAVAAFHGGKKKMHFEGATCGNWDSKLNPLLKEWKTKGGPLPAEKKQDVLWLIEDMGTFVAAVNQRIHAYDNLLKAVNRLCDAAKLTSKEDAALAAALTEQLETMKRTLGNVAGFDKDLAQWQVTLDKMMELAKSAEAFDPELMKVGDIRSFAERQDNTIAGCRRSVNMIKQQAGVAINESGAGSAGLAAKIREECRKVLRNPHPLEHF